MLSNSFGMHRTCFNTRTDLVVLQFYYPYLTWLMVVCLCLFFGVVSDFVCASAIVSGLLYRFSLSLSLESEFCVWAQISIIIVCFYWIVIIIRPFGISGCMKRCNVARHSKRHTKLLLVTWAATEQIGQQWNNGNRQFSVLVCVFVAFTIVIDCY